MTSLKLNILKQMCEPKNTHAGITLPEHLNVLKWSFKVLFPKTMCELQKVSQLTCSPDQALQQSPRVV